MTGNNSHIDNVSYDTIKLFLGKKVKLIRKSNRFVYIGLLKIQDSVAIVLEDRVLGNTFIPISDIGEMNEFKEDYRHNQTRYAD